MFRAIKYSLSLVAALTANLSFGAWDDLNMSPGATQLSQEIFGLHMTVFYVCLAIGIAVLLAMAFILFKYRKKEGVKPADFDDSTALEITWTVLFALILIVLAVPATSVMIKAYDDQEGDIKAPTFGAGLRFGGYGFDFGYTAGNKSHPRSNSLFFSISAEI